MTQEELNKIIENHKTWIESEEEGERADLRRAKLIDVDLTGEDLRDADLERADLRGAHLNRSNLSSAWLREARLDGADLREANLRDASLRNAVLIGIDLKGADLRNTDLRGAYLPEYMYQVTGCGSANRPTTYDVLNDQIICGCWVCDEGNTLENFEKMIEDVYGENGTKPNEKYYQEYMSAIKFFKEMRELNAKSNNRL